MKLLPVTQARARMLAEIRALPAETVLIAEAIGRVLADDVTAVRDQPPFAASAMDGWAVRSADCPGILRIVGEGAAGHGFEGAVGPGEIVRIFTGAAVPADGGVGGAGEADDGVSAAGGGGVFRAAVHRAGGAR